MLNLSPVRVTFAMAGLLAMGIAQAPVVTFTDAVRPIEEEHGRGGERWFTARIVDAITGVPLPGAELLLVAESNHPMRGEFWWQMRAIAGADGFVALRCDKDAPDVKPWGWVVVRAKGYGTYSSMGSLGHAVLPLQPAQTMPVRILDRLHRPVADALVSACGGCGHTPDLAWARTDAQGLALLAGLDPHNDILDFYVEHPELGLGYDSFRWLPGQEPIEFVVEPGVASRGVVVDAAGKPVADAYVGCPTVHRGPWTRTRADGSFALFGPDEAADLQVYRGAQHVIFARTETQPFRLQLPEPLATTGEERAQKTQIVELPERDDPDAELPLVSLHVVDADGDSAPQPRVRIVGPLPQTSERTRIDREPGEMLLPMAPGRYVVFAASADHAETKSEIVVTRDGESENEFELRPTPLPSTVVVVDGIRDEFHVSMRTAQTTRDISEACTNGTPIGLPDEPFWFVLSGPQADQSRLFAYDRKRALATQPLRLPWWNPSHVVGTVVGVDGKPVAATATLVPVTQAVYGFDPTEDPPTETPADRFDLTTEHVGLAFVVVRAEGDKLRPRVLSVMLPRRGDAVRIDLGKIVLGAPTQLVVTDRNGAAHAGAVGFLRAGWNEVREYAPQFPLANGAWQGPDLRAGDAVRLPRTREEDAEGLLAVGLPVRLVLQGDGPWSLQEPAGEVLLDLTSASGNPATFGITLGEAHEATRGRLLLQRVAAGPQRLWLGAAGHRSASVDVVVPPRGRVEVKVTLPLR